FAISKTTQDELVSTKNGTAGDPVLDALINAQTMDDSSLSVTFTTSKPWVEMSYVFSSDEYNEYVGAQYNDTFAFFLNGRNVALLPNREVPVSINSVNNGSNPQFYIDNTDHHIADPNNPSAYFQMDGATVVMKVVSPLLPAVGAQNTMRLSI